MTALRGGDSIQVERGPFRHASPLLRRGYGFFPSPNHLRILAIRLAMGQLYDDPRRFANGFAKPCQTGGGSDHLSQYPLQSAMAEGARFRLVVPLHGFWQGG
jgi:hypothetical protein